jgi:hypothetical protein
VKTRKSKRTALVYDFDGTLARGNIQEVSFIPQIGMTREQFWLEVKQKAKACNGDEILVYLNLMLEKATNAGLQVTRSQLRTHGKAAALFKGLADGSWFKRTDSFAKKRKLVLEHYIISSANYELIEGCSIFKKFKRVFASSYMYDQKGNAIWPSVAVNYTTKTQFLFRINKGIQSIWDNDAVNAFMPENERPIPFQRMIFIGDGDTDIPAMKMVTYKEGHSVAVYDPERDPRTLQKIHRLLSDDRVDFVAPADYTADSQLDIIVRGILGRIARAEGYRPPKDGK